MLHICDHSVRTHLLMAHGLRYNNTFDAMQIGGDVVSSYPATSCPGHQDGENEFGYLDDPRCKICRHGTRPRTNRTSSIPRSATCQYNQGKSRMGSHLWRRITRSWPQAELVESRKLTAGKRRMGNRRDGIGGGGQNRTTIKPRSIWNQRLYIRAMDLGPWGPTRNCWHH